MDFGFGVRIALQNFGVLKYPVAKILREEASTNDVSKKL